MLSTSTGKGLLVRTSLLHVASYDQTCSRVVRNKMCVCACSFRLGKTTANTLDNKECNIPYQITTLNKCTKTKQQQNTDQNHIKIKTMDKGPQIIIMFSGNEQQIITEQNYYK